MTVAAPGGILVIGFGNGLRSDDGIGPAVAAQIATDPRFRDVEVRTVHQLTPELAFDASRVSLLVLVDAAADAPAGTVAVRVLAVAEAGAGEPMTHHIDPAGIVGLAGELYGAAPRAVLVSVGVSTLEVGDRLSTAVEAAIPHAVDAVAAAIEAYARA